MITIPISGTSVYPTATQANIGNVEVALGAPSGISTCTVFLTDGNGIVLSPTVRYLIPDDVYANWGTGGGATTPITTTSSGKSGTTTTTTQVPTSDIAFASSIATAAGYTPTS